MSVNRKIPRGTLRQTPATLPALSTLSNLPTLLWYKGRSTVSIVMFSNQSVTHNMI